MKIFLPSIIQKLVHSHNAHTLCGCKIYDSALRKIDDENIIKSSLALNCFLKSMRVFAGVTNKTNIESFVRCILYDIYFKHNWILFKIIQYCIISLTDLIFTFLDYTKSIFIIPRKLI